MSSIDIPYLLQPTGHKIPTIENLGVAGPQDAIDFTDNDITSISNFPLSPRLTTLLLARNRVRHIQPNLADNLPNLQTLVLTSNNVAELADLDPLRRLTRLTHLSLLENPVVRKEVGNLLPHVEIYLINRLDTELPLLADMANTFHSVSRFSKGERR